MYRLEFPFAFPSANEFLRLHHFERKKRRESLAWAAWLQLVGQGLRRPYEPIEFAYIYVRRFSPGRLDPDNLHGCVKHLLDVMQPASIAQPSGLGIIRQDNDRHLRLTVEQRPASKGESRTVVLIAAACLDEMTVEASM